MDGIRGHLPENATNPLSQVSTSHLHQRIGVEATDTLDLTQTTGGDSPFPSGRFTVRFRFEWMEFAATCQKTQPTLSPRFLQATSIRELKLSQQIPWIRH